MGRKETHPWNVFYIFWNYSLVVWNQTTHQQNLPSEIVAFKEGMFEFNFLIQGPETQYSDPLPWKYIFSKKSSIS
jgi:hypothetical protein